MSSTWKALRAFLRSSLSPDSLVTEDELCGGVLPGRSGAGRRWLRDESGVEPSGTTPDGTALYRWGDVATAYGLGAQVAEAPKSDLLTPKELADALRVPVSTVHRWTSERRISSIKIGHRTVRYRLDEVIESKRIIADESEGETSHERSQARRVMADRLRVHRPRDEPEEEIPPVDWSRRKKAGGGGT